LDHDETSADRPVAARLPQSGGSDSGTILDGRGHPDLGSRGRLVSRAAPLYQLRALPDQQHRGYGKRAGKNLRHGFRQQPREARGIGLSTRQARGRLRSPFLSADCSKGGWGGAAFGPPFLLVWNNPPRSRVCSAHNTTHWLSSNKPSYARALPGRCRAFGLAQGGSARGLPSIPGRALRTTPSRCKIDFPMRFGSS
jgi:hypothetical protein